MSDPDDMQDVLEQLTMLAPEPGDAPHPPAIALARLKQRAMLPASQGIDKQRRKQIMSNRRFIAAGLTLVTAITLLIAFPSVRAAAGEFLGLFRVQKFAPISVSPQQLALLGQLQEQGLTPGEFVTLKEPGEPISVASPEEAASLTGYNLRSLADRDLPIEVYVTEDAAGYLEVDLAGARAIVEAAGVDPLLLPDSLDGARINVETYQAVQQLRSDGLMLMQTPSPNVVYPTDVDPALLGEAFLQILGVEASAARELAQTIDWTGTMLLPIPQGVGTYSEVTIDGVTGVAIQPVDPETDPGIIWQRDGMVYMISGPLPVEDLIQQANRLD
jgi:hypothetical protein